MAIKQLREYTVLPVLLPGTRNISKAWHYLFIKKHVTKDEAESKTRSLFIVNIPVGANFNNMKRLMSQVALGANIESFQACEYYDPDNVINYNMDINLSKLSNADFGEENLRDNRIPVGCGVVTFLDRDGMNLALSSIKKLVMSSKSDCKPPEWELFTDKETGSSRYLGVNNRLNAGSLSKDVYSSMKAFEKREHEVEEELKQMTETVDEDGFTVVVGPHRKTKSGIMGSLKTLTDLEHDEKYSKKIKKKEKKDFYRFQIRERKKQEVNDLLKKFKDDQERVRIMREKRRFNPY
ncbi:hypothetical protein FOA43_000498 [Brettanomyces nanus]|uniref:Ribosomal RNA-processing protein 7 n=1 Tax=Eeniella nana TaxID=13502 RepID=A0A875RVW3_EENNA|nr:uncharacterized protein FOA43_000498 [Brettanomyces nanus]QPG73191.1 hypothetical protein FOA43_000498 [Brettanomyces nanus]